MRRAAGRAPLLLVATLALVLGACGGGGAGSTGADGRTTLRVALDWFPNPDHVALYEALDRGSFADEGLDVLLVSHPTRPRA